MRYSTNSFGINEEEGEKPEEVKKKYETLLDQVDELHKRKGLLNEQMIGLIDEMKTFFDNQELFQKEWKEDECK